MYSLELLRDLYRHMEWADGNIWESVRHVEERPLDERLRALLLHLHTVQQAFLRIWTKQPLAFPRESEFATLAALREWSLPYYAEVHAFLDAVPEANLDVVVPLPWAGELARHLGREPHTPTLRETIFQVTSHSTYHRGQVNARLRELGVEPRLVDYIAWIWFGRPAAGVSQA